MHTIDLNEYLAHVPSSLQSQEWVYKQQSRDMPIEDFIQAVIDDHILQAYAVRFLLERGALTEDQMISFAVHMDCLMPINGNEPLRLSDLFSGGRIPELAEVDLVRKDWRDLRPLSSFASTQKYLFTFAVKMILKCEYTRIVEAPMFSNMAFLQLTERLLGEGSAVELGEAFSHFRWVVSDNKVITLLNTLMDIIKGTPAESKTDYGATLN